MMLFPIGGLYESDTFVHLVLRDGEEVMLLLEDTRIAYGCTLHELLLVGGSNVHAVHITVVGIHGYLPAVAVEVAVAGLEGQFYPTLVADALAHLVFAQSLLQLR